jgi:hypothetical protein
MGIFSMENGKMIKSNRLYLKNNISKKNNFKEKNKFIYFISDIRL